MDKIYIYLARWLTLNTKGSSEDYEIYKYGFQLGIEQGLFIIICIILSIILKAFELMLLFIVIFFLIRPYLGGFHFQKFSYCILLSCACAIIITLLSKTIIFPVHASFILNVFLCGVCYRCFLVKTDVTSENEKIYHKKIILENLICILLFCVVFYVLELESCLMIVFFTLILTILLRVTALKNNS